ncbi:MAG: hypothetical protein KA419_04885 [Acidobacteria bacterium]|nr:hypothetical protein [Acidobacteriota bacterium]
MTDAIGRGVHAAPGEPEGSEDIEPESRQQVDFRRQAPKQRAAELGLGNDHISHSKTIVLSSRDIRPTTPEILLKSAMT